MSNNIILTGPPRSGTTLACFLLNKLDNTLALHEPMKLKMFGSRPEALTNIDRFFDEMRRMALEDQMVISRVKKGRVPDNPFGKRLFWKRRSQVKRSKIKVDKTLGEDFVLIMKHNGHFTFLLDELRDRYPCYAIIRNPLSTIASWNSIKAPVSKGNLKVLKGLSTEIYRELESEKDLIKRQILLADYLFKSLKGLNKNHIIKYEEMISSKGRVLQAVRDQAKHLDEELKSKNRSKNYDKKLMKKIGARLLETDGAFWEFYEKAEVEKLMNLSN